MTQTQTQPAESLPERLPIPRYLISHIQLLGERVEAAKKEQELAQRAWSEALGLAGAAAADSHGLSLVDINTHYTLSDLGVGFVLKPAEGSQPAE